MERFLIPKDVIDKVRNCLISYENHVDEDCARSGCMCDLSKPGCSQWIKDVIHDFDTSLCKQKSPVKAIGR